MIRINPKDVRGPIKPLHGVNLGPQDRNGSLDFTEAFKRWRIPSVRLHDANLTGLDIADIHCMFPDPRADPDDPANYSFNQTDDYLAAIRDAGAEIYFRLGESIEHQRQKKYVRPERWPSPEKMAQVCAHIVRHYNQGWANGFEWNIRDWEFWNEPDLSMHRPPEVRQCWAGTARQFYDFYNATARALKQVDSSLNVGLAGITAHWFAVPEGQEGHVPDHPYRWVIEQAVADGVPIDFVSWHRYAGSWGQIEEAAHTVRNFLDRLGLTDAHSHLTEWAWLPQTSEGLTVFEARRTKNYEQAAKAMELMDGPGSAAFIFGALARLQELPVDLTHYYTGIASMNFGLFHRSGLPRKNAAGFDVFAEFLPGQRIGADSDAPDDFAVLATQDGGKIKVGIAHPKPVSGGATVQVTSGAPANPVARQYTDAGWSDIPISPGNDGLLSIPTAAAGLTIVEWGDGGLK